MRTKYLTVLVLLVSFQLGYGQAKEDSNTINFMNIPDEMIKKEIAFFSKKGKALGSYLESTKLKEVRPWVCDSLVVVFHFGDTYINLYLKEMGSEGQIDSFIPASLFWGTNVKPTRIVDSLALSYHKFVSKIPKAAVSGLYEPSICDFVPPERKKNKIKWLPNLHSFFQKNLPLLDCYKVFTSLDKSHTYIYMLAGEVGRRYEVTWVFHYTDYLYRVVDNLDSDD